MNTWWIQHLNKIAGALGAAIGALQAINPDVITQLLGPKAPGIILILSSVIIAVNGAFGVQVKDAKTPLGELQVKP